MLDADGKVTRSGDPDATPIYSYMLAYDYNINGGFPAWHAAELPMIFGNMDDVSAMHDEEAISLSDKMLDAWASFAHTGDPNHDGLPTWMPYTKDTRATMIFDKQCDVRNDYDRELIALHQKYLRK